MCDGISHWPSRHELLTSELAAWPGLPPTFASLHVAFELVDRCLLAIRPSHVPPSAVDHVAPRLLRRRARLGAGELEQPAVLAYTRFTKVVAPMRRLKCHQSAVGGATHLLSVQSCRASRSASASLVRQ
jgi:hypothetical protein